MKQRVLSIVTALALCMCIAAPSRAYALQEAPFSEADYFEPTAAADPIPYADGDIPTPQEAYAAMIALKSNSYFAEGAPWTNETHSYKWNGGKLDGNVESGQGCVAFAFRLSDKAFGSLPARMYANGQFKFSDVKNGDILRVNNDAHTVIVLQVSDVGVVLAEGNYHENGGEGFVHWGRTMTKAEVEAADHYITRYPVDYIPPDDPTANDPIEGGTGFLEGGLQWKLTKSGTLTISGNGSMPDYSASGEQPWYAHNDKIIKIVIEDGVTRIGNCAFWESGAFSVEIPDSVEAIGNSAFRDGSLIAATIPASVKSIGDSAFRGCTSLATVTLSEGLETIEQNVFNSCEKLISISLPASITSVGAAAFTNCTELTQVVFTPSENQVQLGDNLFTRCWKLASVTLPQKMDSVSDGMFQNCLMLSSVMIPEGVTSIGPSAFASCQVMSSLTIPKSVTQIGMAAFSNCSSLKDIYFGGTEAEWKRIQIVPPLSTAVTIHYSSHIHSWDTEWSGDDSYHWYECTVEGCDITENSQKGGYGAHTYGLSDSCTVCGRARPGQSGHNHAWATAWSTDESNHWHNCTAEGCDITENSKKDSYGAHTYDANNTCTVCGYVQPGHKHAWDSKWTTDELYHWHKCTAEDCDITDESQMNGYGAHVYDDEEDLSCNTCGYTRPAHNHSWATEWTIDEFYHWHECTEDGCYIVENSQKDGYASHIYDDEADTICNICEYERPEHEHSWDESNWSNDESHHWHECTAEHCYIVENSEKDGYGEHDYDEDGACTICGYTPEHEHDWSSKWNSNSSYHWHECTAKDCDITENSDKDGYGKHDYDSWVVDEKATEDEDGSRHRTCTVCGRTQTESIPATGSSSSDRNTSSRVPTASNKTNTTTTQNTDGSTTTTKTDNRTGTVTETTVYPDGSQTVVETQKDGTVTTMETDRSGNKTETVTNPDGSSVISVAQNDGTTAKVTTNSTGKMEAEVRLPSSVVSNAQQSGGKVTLPIPEVQASRNGETAPSVTVKTGSTEPTTVEIPVANPGPGTVAVIVRADGTEEVVKMSVPAEGAVAVPLSDGATVKIIDNSKSFSDVSAQHWAVDAVSFVSARELFDGTAATTFSPEAPMTRAMLITVLARLDGVDVSGGTTWYEKGMAWAIAKQISDGSNPDESVTREQLVTMLWRYAGSPAAAGTMSGFTDANELSGFAQEAMRWAVESGIIGGFSDGRLAPQGQATRAQVAQILMSFIRK